MQEYTPKKIGILGGMGPAASAELYKRIVAYCQTHYHCVQDSDYPQIFVNSLTLKGFDEEGIVEPELVKTQLIAGIRQLSDWVDIIAIPCNTVHVFYEEMCAASNVPILSLPELCARRVSEDRHTKIGLLASASTRQMGLYENVMRKHAIEIMHVPEQDQHKITGIIERVMGGKNTIHDSSELYHISRNLISSGATAVVFGCTELPFAMNHMGEIVAYDTLQILVEGVVDSTLARTPPPSTAPESPLASTRVHPGTAWCKRERTTFSLPSFGLVSDSMTMSN